MSRQWLGRTVAATTVALWVGATAACAPSLASYASPFSVDGLREHPGIVVSELCSSRHFVVVNGQLVRVPRGEPSSETFRRVGRTLRAANVQDVGVWSNCKLMVEAVCAISSDLAAEGVTILWMRTPSAFLLAGHVDDVPKLCGGRERSATREGESR